jgi:hypothetical protein
MNTFTVPLHLLTAHPARRNTEVVLAQGVKLGEGFLLDVVLGDDPFTCAAMADVVLLAEPVVDACVDDFAVARACFCAYGIVALYEDG